MNEPARDEGLDPIARQRLRALAAAGKLSQPASQHYIEPPVAAEDYCVQRLCELEARPRPPLTVESGDAANPGPAESGERQISLLGLFSLVSLAAAVLAMRSWLAPPAFAGVAGMLVLGYLFARSLLGLRSALYTLGGWILVLLYLTAVAMALKLDG
jgi:hypothetical protein